LAIRYRLRRRLLRDPEGLYPLRALAVRVRAACHPRPDLAPVDIDLHRAAVRAFQKIPMLVGELRQLLPENEEELGALVLQQIAITFDVTEEKFRAVAKRAGNAS